MSTDITVVVITRRSFVDDDGKEYWFAALYGHGFDLSQRYDLFCKLAGVRCRPSDIPPPWAARGLPAWVPSYVSEGFAGLEAITWLTPSEFLSVVEGMQEDEVDQGWECLARCLRDVSSVMGEERVRVLVGFF
jgi:hypothetical protein